MFYKKKRGKNGTTNRPHFVLCISRLAIAYRKQLKKVKSLSHTILHRLTQKSASKQAGSPVSMENKRNRERKSLSNCPHGRVELARMRLFARAGTVIWGCWFSLFFAVCLLFFISSRLFINNEDIWHMSDTCGPFFCLVLCSHLSSLPHTSTSSNHTHGVRLAFAKHEFGNLPIENVI